MEKLFCMQVAAQLTVAACNGVGSGIQRAIDPTLQDPNQRAVNLEVWEIFRAYYNAVTQALADDKSWPAPAVAQGAVIPGVISNGIQAALPALSQALGTGPLGAILQTLLKSIPQTASLPPVTGNIPNPGTPTTK